LERRRRSEQGEPVVGRIPDGPHRLAEAQAHLAREIVIHQAKLDRYPALIAAGKKPMGRPPVPMEMSTRIARARRVVRNAEAAAARAVAVQSPRYPRARRVGRRSWRSSAALLGEAVTSTLTVVIGPGSHAGQQLPNSCHRPCHCISQLILLITCVVSRLRENDGLFVPVPIRGLVTR
jgi:hypothetical protein